jgi:antitoxin (DNA-binding transcriptional repressor) of toxin-antitoxin stability system
MPMYPMHFAKTNLSDLVARAEAGEEVILARGRKPAVRLVPVPAEGARRRPGRLKGRLAVGLEFFEPLPEDELALWEGR